MTRVGQEAGAPESALDRPKLRKPENRRTSPVTPGATPAREKNPDFYVSLAAGIGSGREMRNSGCSGAHIWQPDSGPFVLVRSLRTAVCCGYLT